MPKSMTGYSKLDYYDTNYKITCELKTLNSKGLDIHISLPYYLSSKEVLIAKIVSNFISRGRVSVKLNVRFLKPININLDFAMAKSYYDNLEELRESLGIQKPIKLSDLLMFKELFRTDIEDEEIEKLWVTVEVVLKKTLEKLLEERKSEGEKLSADIKNMLVRLEEIVSKIEFYAKDLKNVIAQRIKENVQDILPENIELDMNQFETAVALIADRADIREEIVRLKSHLNRMKELLNSDGPIGTLFNFLTQEVHREFNTILSKSRMLELSDLAIEGKFTNSQLKEQIQNLE
ncbi:TIGR00255 family protein [Thermosipho atlanticus DSM 15807]|uniref:TIGR00255 family protein n=1 Tax=Thermosipho atlanticus DSM 15807 TaxID=1123380 RepID=A0A1M5S1Y9_9BACT|nr:TIGR00255 family protein [Thermosipho atlanticus DSM 15807]